MSKFSNRLFSNGDVVKIVPFVPDAPNVCGQFSTYTSSNAVAWSCGELVQAPTAPAPSADGNYFQIIFLNRSREVIKTFFSLQEAIQGAKLVYAADGGLKSAEFNVLFNSSIPSYNDMLVEFRTESGSLGTVFTSSVAVVDNILTIKGVSAFNRFASDLQLTGEISNKSFKDVIVFFLQMIFDALVANDEPPFFTVDPDAIQVDPTLTVDSVFFIKKKPLDILKGLANLAGGRVVYGIDEFFRFYFIDQKLIERKTVFVDTSAFDARMSTNDEDVQNRVSLFSQRQTGEELGLIAVYDDIDSQAQFGVKPVSVNLPFYLDSEEPASYAKLFVTPKPLLKGDFTMHNVVGPVDVGNYRVVEYLSSERRILANSCKDLSTIDVNAESTMRTNAVFVTGRFAYSFLNGTALIRAVVMRCKHCILTMRSDEDAVISWVYDGVRHEQQVIATKRMRQVVIETMGLDEGVKVSCAGTFTVDSLHYVTDFVQYHEGYYQGHEITLKGDTNEVKIKMGQNKNSLIDLTKDLKTNARQLDDLLKRG